MKIIILLCTFLFLLGCEKEKEKEPKHELMSIQSSFETTLEDWKEKGGSGERYYTEDISIASAKAYEGENLCKFRVTPESYVAKGNRTELTFDQGAVEGDESWYEWSIYIPSSYQDVLLEDSTGAPHWQVMGQWHQQPDFEGDEDWGHYSEQGKSVPLAFNYLYFTNDDPEYIALKNDPRTATLYGYDST